MKKQLGPPARLIIPIYKCSTRSLLFGDMIELNKCCAVEINNSKQRSGARLLTLTVSVTFSRPSMLITTRIPLYSGYINIQSSNNETFHLPYAGVACSMKEVIVTDFEVTPPYVSNSSDTNSMSNPINANVTFNVTNDLPNFNWRLVMGSSVVRLDVLGNGNQTQVAGINILGSVPDFPVYWAPRNYLAFSNSGHSSTWKGTLDNGVHMY